MKKLKVMKYVVSVGWDLGCDQMHTDYQRTFDSKEAAEAFMWSILKNNTKEYDISRVEVLNCLHKK